MAAILDSDMLSILQRRSEPACGRLEERLSQLPDQDVFTTIVTFQEQMRVWLAALHKATRVASGSTHNASRRSMSPFAGGGLLGVK